MLNLLIVEDMRFVRLGIKNNIENNDVMVYESETYTSAINILKQNIIDILLLDLNLNAQRNMNTDNDHVKNGIDILEYIVENNINMPYVIIISGNLDQGNIMKAYEFSIKKFLSKPYTPDSLKYEINCAIKDRMKLKSEQTNQSV